MIFKEALAIVTGYLLGSIPTAYLITRAIKGTDIRRLGGGNIGGLNTIREVGRVPGFAVMIIDMAKGAAGVSIAFWLLGVPPLFVMLTGFAAVIGHMWMVFLKFSGGRGMGAAIGSIITILGIYQQWLVMGIFLFIVAAPIIITHNVPISMFAGFLSLPFLAWFAAGSLEGAILAAALGFLVGGKFLSTAAASWRRSKSLKNFIFHDSNPRPDSKNGGN
jgi:glycerol-3-phosphate acyltransferase PlsY